MSDEKIVKRKPESAITISLDGNQRIGNGLIDALTRNSEETGSRLLNVAIGRVETEFANTVLRQIEELVKHKASLLNAIEKTAKEVDLTERRLAAIDAGEFKVDFNGKITYNELVLNYN